VIALAIVAAVAALSPAAVEARTTVRCDAKAFQAFLGPPGQIRVVEYRLGTAYDNRKPIATTHVLAYVDATTHRFAPDCRRVTHRAFAPRDLVGPYPRDVDNRVFCSSSSFAATAESARYTLLQFRHQLDAGPQRLRHQEGRRHLVRADGPLHPELLAVDSPHARPVGHLAGRTALRR
jgi:hypothetical protein